MTVNGTGKVPDALLVSVTAVALLTGCVSVTVRVAVPPLITGEGLIVTEAITGVVVPDAPLNVAVTV